MDKRNKIKLLLKKRENIIWIIIKKDKNKFEKLYNLLSEIINLFDKSDIKYWAIKGTLLGVIRNNSIIPWDDNINLGILETDIHKLIYKDFGKSINKLNIIGIKKQNEIIFYKREYPKYLLKINWINTDKYIFFLEKKLFGPLTINIPSNFKDNLNNEYNNIDICIITKSNTSNLLTKYINILKYYNGNYVKEKKFIKYNTINIYN